MPRKTKNKIKVKFSRFVEENHFQVVFILGLFLLIGLMMKTDLFYLKTDLFAEIKSEPYDGLVMPIKKVPNWVALSPEQWRLDYNSLPASGLIDLPAYNPTELAMDSKSLNLSTIDGKRIRNAQVTYSVPYMGSYELDGLEFSGSHLAVDIKTVIDTPIYSIGNGVIVKVASQSSGFGNHICIRYDNFPSFENADLKATYYACYSHLSQNLVTAGQVVKKGDLIGNSGQSGTATTPHLHFQIDKDSVPWHPYWPFTTKEATDAGYSFFEAINNGLNQDKAIAATINPMLYIKKYQNNVVTSDTTVTPTETVPVTPTVITVPVVTTISDPVSPDPVIVAPIITPPVVTTVVTEPVQKFGKLDLKYDPNFKLDNPLIVKVIALDDSGKVLTSFNPESEISLKIENGSAFLDKTYLKGSDFSGGIAQFQLTPRAEFGLKFSVLYAGQTYSSNVLQASIFTDLTADNSTYSAISFLREKGVIRGYPDGSFRPDQNISRAEALKLIYEGLNKEVKLNVDLGYKDTDSKSWYARYVAAATKDGIVQGYAGNLFRPENPVTRAEFLKMLELSAGYDLANLTVINPPYDDVAPDSWYSKYFFFAKQKKLLDEGLASANPNQALTRAEVAEILYRTVAIKIANSLNYSSAMALDPEAANEFYGDQV